MNENEKHVADSLLARIADAPDNSAIASAVARYREFVQVVNTRIHGLVDGWDGDFESSCQSEEDDAPVEQGAEDTTEWCVCIKGDSNAITWVYQSEAEARELMARMSKPAYDRTIKLFKSVRDDD